MVEQLICNQQVVGSSPISGSTFIAGVRSYRQGHPVVTRKVAGSSPAAPAIHYIACSHRLTVRTLVFHTSNRGSIPRASTKLGKYDMLDYIEAMVAVTVLMGLAVWFYLEKR